LVISFLHKALHLYRISFKITIKIKADFLLTGLVFLPLFIFDFMKKILLLTLLTISYHTAHSQVGIGNSSPKAQLDITASNPAAPTGIDGILIPRINNFPSSSPVAAQNGMLVFLTTTSGTNLPGFYYWSNPALAWVGLNSNNKSWDTSGNSAAVSGTNFIGTTNAQDVDFRTNNLLKMRLTLKGQLETLNTGKSVFVGEQAGLNDDLSNNNNVFIGYQSGFANTTGYNNAAIGFQSLKGNTTGFYNSAFGLGALQNNTTGNSNTAGGLNALFSNTTGTYNTAFGTNALTSNVTSIGNTAVGMSALRNNLAADNTALGAHSLQSNTSGYGNTATGGSALITNDDGYYNTATGFTAMMNNVSGFSNTAVGTSALYNNTDGNNNTATGVSAMLANVAGNNNAAYGAYALRDNTVGGGNTAMGRNALLKNGTGSNNTATGTNSLSSNTIGTYNTVSGVTAMLTNTIGNNNTATGASSLYFNTEGNSNTATGTASLLNNTLGNNNTAIGNSALSVNITGSNNTAVGNLANVGGAALSNATAIGYQATASISNKVRLGNASVTVVEGQVAYFNPSDARFKNDIGNNVPGLDFIMKLKPVTYHFDTKKFDEHLMLNMPDSLKTGLKNQDYSLSSRILHSGFLAQDIEKAAQSIGYDFDGLHIPDASNPADNYSVAYSQFIMPIVKAMQEQQAMIEKQQTELEQAKSENANLKATAEKQRLLLESLESRISAIEKKK